MIKRPPLRGIWSLVLATLCLFEQFVILGFVICRQKRTCLPG